MESFRTPATSFGGEELFLREKYGEEADRRIGAAEATSAYVSDELVLVDRALQGKSGNHASHKIGRS